MGMIAHRCASTSRPCDCKFANRCGIILCRHDLCSLIVHHLVKTERSCWHAPGLAAAVWPVATLTSFSQLVRHPYPGDQQQGCDDRGQEVRPHAVTVAFRVAGRRLAFGKFSLWPHYLAPLRDSPQGTISSPSSPAFFPKY